MIHEVQLGRACDTLRLEMEKEITLGVNAQVKADSVISAQQRQIALRDEAITVQTDRIINAEKQKQELRSEIRQQRRLTIAVGIASLLTLIIFL